VQVTDVPAVQVPDWQVSVWVHALLSLHEVPFALAGFEQAPVSTPHAPASWHWSAAEQLIGFDPVQKWLWQVDDPVHGLWSSHAVPFAAVVHWPQGSLIFAVTQPPGMKQWPALPLKNVSLLPLHFALNCQCANGSRNVACPLAFVVLLPDVIPSVDVGVTARPEIGLPLPSTRVTTDDWLTRIVAVVHPGWAQFVVVAL
jgi:hypothetical protein